MRQNIKIPKKYLTGMIIGAGIILGSYILSNEQNFPLFAGIGVLIILTPFLMSILEEVRRNNEKEEMFLEFARNLVESVKTGTPISKSIINMSKKDFGALSIHVRKLGNQISLGIPLNKALDVFAKDVRNKSISRSLTLIGQAERAGGDIGEILEAVAGAVNLSDKLKKERKAAISNLVVQGYIIFLVFILIILVMQFQIIPMVSGISTMGESGLGGFGLNVGGVSGEEISQEQISNSFLYLIIFQGFFTGLAIGKLSEGSLKAGLKHSFSLAFLSFLISAGANALLG